MQSQKRDWIFAGLAHPQGVALARPAAAATATRVPIGSRVLLVGDRHVQGLSPSFRQLCSSKSADLLVQKLDILDKEAEIIKAVDKIFVLASSFNPNLVLVSLPWPRSVSSEEIAQAARKLVLLRRRGRTVVWLRPPKATLYTKALRLILDEARLPSFHSEALQLPLGPAARTPTAAGYAGWAGALWRWLR